MVRTTRLAIYEIQVAENGRLVTQYGDFDAASYSNMKYGHTVPARDYGYRLAGMLADANPTLLADSCTPVVIYGPATRHTPKPAQAIAFYLTQLLNHWRAEHRLPPAQLHDMKHVRQGSAVPYATLNPNQRRVAMAATIDYADPNMVRGSRVICVDDLIVTGAVEAKMTETLEPLRPAEIDYLYAIRVNPSLAATDPQVEDRINAASGPCPKLLAEFLERGEFLLNDRALRMLLTWPTEYEVRALLDSQDDLFLEVLLNELSATGFHYYDFSRHLIRCLWKVLEERQHPWCRPVAQSGHR
ncbi:phosphoribosyltransferase family protein [Nucisporomicrobium flavum]|uniref:phosphoribosyltransferase family protein n=1 Tax=Nucisporomicrobium flavum TaxID=2785915 RepID=UPI0018F7384E|nr:phosphoribosyltransferase family protein [Nucisporomicrobium flavum]